VQASVEFLRNVWVAVVKPRGSYNLFPDEDFAEFVGVSVGSDEASATTLCFIIDTTGSMSDEIAAVRKETIRMTQKARDASDYVLSPFNDPGINRSPSRRGAKK